VALITGFYLLFLFTPIVLLFVGSFGETWTNTLLPTGSTLSWYLELWGEGSFRRAFVVSLEVVAATCAICTMLAVPLAYALYRSASRGVMLAARIVFLLPIAAPPVVLAFGFILVFSTDALPWLGSIWLLIAGHVVLTLPYLLQTLVADMRHLRLDALELAAESLGASLRERFLDVVVPLLRHSLGSGLIMVAALSIGEFQLSNLIAGFLSRPYPVVLLQAFYGATGFACAATVVLLSLALLAAAGGAVAARSASTYRQTRR
jgi:putative spermidine/putrescine transport system permease protein